MSVLTPEQEEQKRAIYEKMNPRRRKFVDRIGYDKWDPFAMPKDPIEIRKDPTNRTVQQLVTDFLRSREAHQGYSEAYASGAMELAVGVLRREDRYEGMLEFGAWYKNLMEKEGVSDAD
ncbi:hypothetical protein DPQ33_10255 [Oceanidesulfovibrio indonesiensis]|uniref:Uncharacterized protein n=1 Tax=Oceanidesulfovibrio indonesiensis TaxID=54767 RepID=A0A7M3MED7_9BACT|nr:hypothetical protein [Oceanidesulfovibrio indonesiensis]TVM17164.1 hypothetical protein DPQ33_10255 [Oceanidesulfovibrio indonesiensis]